MRHRHRDRPDYSPPDIDLYDTAWKQEPARRPEQQSLTAMNGKDSDHSAPRSDLALITSIVQSGYRIQGQNQGLSDC